MKLRFNKRTVSWLLAILVIELAVCFVSKAFAGKPFIAGGFVSKRGNRYVVFWKEEGRGMFLAEYDSLKEALRYASETLDLTQGRNLRPGFELERAWIEDRDGVSIVFWKVEGLRLLNQMTFQSQNEARQFAMAIRRGFYSPSPVGHAMILSPKSIGRISRK